MSGVINSRVVQAATKKADHRRNIAAVKVLSGLGWSIKEIAETVSISESSVRSLLKEAHENSNSTPLKEAKDK